MKLFRMAESASHVFRCRWGDYSGITMDPDGVTFWAFNAYGQLNNGWGTWLAAFQCKPALQASAGAKGRKLLSAEASQSESSGLRDTAIPISSAAVDRSRLEQKRIFSSKVPHLDFGGATNSPGSSGCDAGASCGPGQGCGGGGTNI